MEEMSYKDLKANVFYFLNTYKKVVSRYTTMNYDCRYLSKDRQFVTDAQFLEESNRILAVITKGSHDYIMYEIIFPEKGYKYTGNCSRATIYRIRKKAIMEVAECLHLTKQPPQ